MSEMSAPLLHRGPHLEHPAVHSLVWALAKRATPRLVCVVDLHTHQRDVRYFIQQCVWNMLSLLTGIVLVVALLFVSYCGQFDSDKTAIFRVELLTSLSAQGVFRAVIKPSMCNPNGSFSLMS